MMVKLKMLPDEVDERSHTFCAPPLLCDVFDGYAEEEAMKYYMAQMEDGTDVPKFGQGAS